MIERIRQFLREVKVETKKVVYPTREELISSTWVVIVTVLIVSAYLGAVDLGLSRFVKYLLR
ncbi:MAG: preprotein translocase subunit SecE [Nitrospirota bacterium]|jgi:preprotein translocase subunit SecE